MASVSLKTIEQNDNVSLFSSPPLPPEGGVSKRAASPPFRGQGGLESEFEKFMLKFKDNATYNKDLVPLQ